MSRSIMREIGAMTLEIKKNVDMQLREPRESIPTIPWDQMFYKDAYDIPVTEDSLKRKSDAIRSAYKRYLIKAENPPQREFFIGKQYVDHELVVRVYCKKGPNREGDEPSQSGGTYRQGSEP
mgnify:FL=1